MVSSPHRQETAARKLLCLRSLVSVPHKKNIRKKGFTRFHGAQEASNTTKLVNTELGESEHDSPIQRRPEAERSGGATRRNRKTRLRRTRNGGIGKSMAGFREIFDYSQGSALTCGESGEGTEEAFGEQRKRALFSYFVLVCLGRRGVHVRVLAK
jgi:hypothetical protein